MRGAPIEALQHLLRRHGSSITADGIVGPVTWQAMVANGD